MLRNIAATVRKKLGNARVAVAHDLLGIRAPTPRWFTLNVIRACNMRCRHCETPNFAHAGKDLSLEEIRSLARELGPLDVVGLGGGEPFLREDLDEIAITFAHGNGARTINVASNGSFPERIHAKAEHILGSCPDTKLSLVLSLDGFQETHDAIRQSKGAFEGVVASARGLSSLRSRFANLEFVFNATLHAGNYQELPSLARWVQSEFQTVLAFNVMSGEPRDSGMTLPEPAVLQRAVDELFELTTPASARAYMGVFRELRQQALAKHRLPLTCQGGNLAAIVFANGDVHACPLRPAMGNLRSGSFGEIWNGEEARRQFREIRAGKCPPCTDDCFLSISMAYSLKAQALVAASALRNRRQ